MPCCDDVPFQRLKEINFGIEIKSILTFVVLLCVVVSECYLGTRVLLNAH